MGDVSARMQVCFAWLRVVQGHITEAFSRLPGIFGLWPLLWSPMRIVIKDEDTSLPAYRQVPHIWPWQTVFTGWHENARRGKALLKIAHKSIRCSIKAPEVARDCRIMHGINWCRPLLARTVFR